MSKVVGLIIFKANQCDISFFKTTTLSLSEKGIDIINVLFSFDYSKNSNDRDSDAFFVSLSVL